MLIKNSRGDWGIVTAFWEGYKKAVRGIKLPYLKIAKKNLDKN